MSTALQEQVNLLYKRVAALEAWKESFEKNPSSPSPSHSLVAPLINGSRDAWLITKKMEAKEKMAKELKDRYCSEVAFGPQWDDDGVRSEYMKLKHEIRALNEQLAAL